MSLYTLALFVHVSGAIGPIRAFVLKQTLWTRRW